ELPLPAPIGAHHPELRCVVLPGAIEDDEAPVRREERCRVGRSAARQLTEPRTVGADGVDLEPAAAIAREHERALRSRRASAARRRPGCGDNEYREHRRYSGKKRAAAANREL